MTHAFGARTNVPVGCFLRSKIPHRVAGEVKVCKCRIHMYGTYAWDICMRHMYDTYVEDIFVRHIRSNMYGTYVYDICVIL